MNKLMARIEQLEKELDTLKCNLGWYHYDEPEYIQTLNEMTKVTEETGKLYDRLEWCKENL